MNEDIRDKILEIFLSEKFSIDQFHKRLINYFADNPKLSKTAFPIIHSIKFRIKDINHLKEKLDRKDNSDNPITENNFFDRITDLAGIRILHLYPSHFEQIHNEIMSQTHAGEWFLFEPPIAYTWDPVLEKIFKGLEINTEIKESYYTSVHYILMPQKISKIKCEVQVRTLFEEIWGEIDHSMSYPKKSDSVSCIEQLKVLSSLSATGSRLLESILKSKNEYEFLSINIRETQSLL
ncbi:MAG TPA: (p)ppGpp synthetase [Atribacterota bacterium]|nr:(p)ppGpp synthetase [Atribacterota bacterium]